MPKSKKWQVLHSSKVQSWETPDDLFKFLDELYGPFGLDAAANHQNFKCTPYFTPSDDALKQSWHLISKHVWLNPPYGRDLYKWVEKGWREAHYFHARVVMLLPSRTGTRWFQDFFLKARKVIFWPGRITFKGTKDPAPFDSVIFVFE